MKLRERIAVFVFCLFSSVFAFGQGKTDSVHTVQRSIAAQSHALMNDKKYLDALNLLEPEIKKKGIQDTVRDLLEILYIRSLHGAGRCDSSIEAGKDWADRDPHNIKPYFELFDIYFSLGDYYNAAHQLELALMRKPGDALMLSQAAFLYIFSEEQVKGEKLSKLALERAKSPREWAAARTAKALLHVKRKEYQEALQLCKEAIADDVSYPESFYVLALTYSRLGRQDMVCQPLLNAIERNGGPWCKDFYETKCGK
jgi:tetratricopeptide (TPR) repeat protein